MKKMLFFGSMFLLFGFGCAPSPEVVIIPSEDTEVPLPPDTKPTKTSFEVYFIDPEMQDFDCSVVDFEKRTVDATENVEELAVRELIEGPESNWAITSVPAGTTLNTFSIEDGVARVDFGSPDITKWSGGSCFVTSLRSQIEHTLLQFSTIDEVEISVNGESEEILQP